MRSTTLLPILEAAAQKRMAKAIAGDERRLAGAIRTLYLSAGSTYTRKIKFREYGVVSEAVGISNISSAITTALAGVRVEFLDTVAGAFGRLFGKGWRDAPKNVGAGAVPDTADESRKYAAYAFGVFSDKFRSTVSRQSENLSTRGLTGKEITDQLHADFKTHGLTVGKGVAGDASIAGYSAGLAGAAKAVRVKRKVWLTAGDDRVDELCTANAGAGTIDIDKDFPSGVAYPPAHAYCRCLVDYSWSIRT